MILQAKEYETEQGKSLQDFFDSTAGKWKTEYGYALSASQPAAQRVLFGNSVSLCAAPPVRGTAACTAVVNAIRAV